MHNPQPIGSVERWRDKQDRRAALILYIGRGTRGRNWRREVEAAE